MVMADAKTYAERSGGAWHRVSWPMRLLPLMLLSWTVAYLLATATSSATLTFDSSLDAK